MDASIPFPTDRLFIGGEWRAAAGADTLALDDPSDGSELARIARGTAADVDAAVAAARDALESGAVGSWGRMSAVACLARSAARCSTTSSCSRASRPSTSASR